VTTPTQAQIGATAIETEPQLLERLGDDAAKWAAEFCKTAIKLGYSDMDEGRLIGWFANAIENAHQLRTSLTAAAQVGEQGHAPEYFYDPPRKTLLTKSQIEAATIERCAQVADNMAYVETCADDTAKGTTNAAPYRKVADAIRKLKVPV
jgi:hypothetical protein